MADGSETRLRALHHKCSLSFDLTLVVGGAKDMEKYEGLAEEYESLINAFGSSTTTLSSKKLEVFRSAQEHDLFELVMVTDEPAKDHKRRAIKLFISPVGKLTFLEDYSIARLKRVARSIALKWTMQLIHSVKEQDHIFMYTIYFISKLSTDIRTTVNESSVLAFADENVSDLDVGPAHQHFDYIDDQIEIPKEQPNPKSVPMFPKSE